MSEEDNHSEEASNIRVKPPYSLRDVENAERVWDMIRRRFPNAAPLLYELEDVLECAHVQLQKLRNSHLLDDETGSTGPDESIPSYSSSANDCDSLRLIHSLDHRARSDNRVRTPDEMPLDDNERDDLDRVGPTRQEARLSVNNDRDGRAYVGSTRARSRESTKMTLEDWSGAHEDSTGCTRMWTTSSGGGDRCSMTEPRNEKIPLPVDRLLSKNEAAKIADFSMDNKIECSTGDKNEMCDTTGNASENRCRNIRMEDSENAWRENKNENEVPRERTAVEILEDYAKRCRAEIEYTGPIATRTNRYAMSCSYAGYKAESSGETKTKAKENACMKILELLASAQMDGRKLDSLSDLAREEILTIINYGTIDMEGFPNRRLYKLCLDLDEPPPCYEIKKKATANGIATVAKCSALSHTGHGQCVRAFGARKEAATNLLLEYESGLASRERLVRDDNC